MTFCRAKAVPTGIQHPALGSSNQCVPTLEYSALTSLMQRMNAGHDESHEKHVSVHKLDHDPGVRGTRREGM